MDTVLVGMVVTVVTFLMPGILMATGAMVPVVAILQMSDGLKFFFLRNCWLLGLAMTYVAYQMHEGAIMGTVGAVVAGLTIDVFCRIWRIFQKKEELWPDGTPKEQKAARKLAETKEAVA